MNQLKIEETYKIYSDKKRTFIQHPVNYKQVFQIWANYVFDKSSDLSLTQLKNIFPEFIAHLDLYDKCMNQQGQVIKNKDYYKTYKQTPHKAGKRSKTQK